MLQGTLENASLKMLRKLFFMKTRRENSFLIEVVAVVVTVLLLCFTHALENINLNVHSCVAIAQNL